MIRCRFSQFSMTAMKSSTASHTNDNACPSAPEDHLAVSRAAASRASAPYGVRGSARLISRRDVSHRSRNSDSKGSLPKSHSLPIEDCRDRTCLSHSAWSARNRPHAAIRSPSSIHVRSRHRGDRTQGWLCLIGPIDGPIGRLLHQTPPRRQPGFRWLLTLSSVAFSAHPQSACRMARAHPSRLTGRTHEARDKGGGSPCQNNNPRALIVLQVSVV